MPAKTDAKTWLRRCLVLPVILWMAVFVARFVFSQIDYASINGGGTPVFAQPVLHHADGGTVDYAGFGYRITRLHRVHTSEDGTDGFLYGPVLQYKWKPYLLPLADRDDIRFVTQRQ